MKNPDIALVMLLLAALLVIGLVIAGAMFIVRLFRRKSRISPPTPQPPLAPPPVVAATVALPKCPQCRQPLPENAPEGLCPACLAKVGLGTEPVPPGATVNINPLAQAAGPTRVPPTPAQLAEQFPQLEIIELLGMGGMGTVYKARQPRLDRIVALKILPVESQQHPSFAERFGREAKALAKLSHPGIVTIFDFGQTAQYYYFIMEYVDGMNLRHLLHNQPLEPRQALELVTQICTALQFAHDEGVVHRDIKPENILLNKKGQVKIADFGLAKLLGAAPDTALTMSQATMGTLNYMAPEQRMNAQGVDHRADIYSLGVVFYEMLTGEVPMGRFDPPSKRVQVDVRLDEVVLKALEREPARRYQHASEVKTGVETITSTSQGAAPVTNASPNLAPKQLPGSDTTWVVLFAVEMVLTLGLGAFLLQIVPAVGFVWILAVFLVASYQLNSRKEIQRARESGMWPQLGEVPALEHVKRLAQAGKKVLAIKLYRQMHGASLADAKAAVEKLTVQSAPPRDPKAQPPAAPPLVAPKPDHFWRKVVVVVLALIAIPFVVAFVGLLAAIAIPNFVKARDQSQKNATQQSDKEGWQLWQAGNFDAAQKKFSQVVEKLDPANVEAWNGLGWTWLNAGQPLAAETNFQKALSLEATCPGALNGLGRLYLLQRNYEEGEKYLLQAAPTQHAAWDGLSRLYLLDGKFDSAAEWAQKLVDSGNADDTARQMLQAAREKHVSDDLRRIVEKPTHDLNDTH